MIMCSDRSCSGKCQNFPLTFQPALLPMLQSLLQFRPLPRSVSYSSSASLCIKLSLWTFSVIVISNFHPSPLMCKNGSIEGLSVQTLVIDEKCHIFPLKFPSALVPVLQSLLQFWLCRKESPGITAAHIQPSCLCRTCMGIFSVVGTSVNPSVVSEEYIIARIICGKCSGRFRVPEEASCFSSQRRPDKLWRSASLLSSLYWW
jgi:hypothetical protein